MNNKREQIQQEASSLILKDKDLILFISIRLGKTRIALKAIEENDKKILVIYPNKAIRESWIDEFNKCGISSHNVTFSVRNGLKKLKDSEFDYVIIDEPQLLSNKQIEYLSTIKYNKRVALSGTLKDTTIKKLKNKLGLEVKYKYGINEAIKDKLVKDYKIYIHVDELNKNNSIQYKKYGNIVTTSESEAYKHYTKSIEYFDKKYQETGEIKYNMGLKKYINLRTNLLYNSKSLYELARSLISLYKEDKTLIYTLRRDMADLLSSNSYHTGNKSKDILNEFKEAKNGHLSVVNCVQAGVTIKHLDRVIFHTYESNTELFYQKLGRSLLYEYDGQLANIHICCLKDTQMEVWVNNACKSLEQNKINYIYNNKVYTKIEWLKFKYPNKKLYIYNDNYCYLDDEIQEEYSNYKFIDNPNKSYILNINKLTKI